MHFSKTFFRFLEVHSTSTQPCLLQEWALQKSGSLKVYSVNPTIMVMDLFIILIYDRDLSMIITNIQLSLGRFLYKHNQMI